MELPLQWRLACVPERQSWSAALLGFAYASGILDGSLQWSQTANRRRSAVVHKRTQDTDQASLGAGDHKECGAAGMVLVCHDASIPCCLISRRLVYAWQHVK